MQGYGDTVSAVSRHVPLLAVPLLPAVAAGARDVLRARRPGPAPGEELKPGDHPALWAELEFLAREMKQRRPDRVVVQPTVNAYVTESAGLRRRSRPRCCRPARDR